MLELLTPLPSDAVLVHIGPHKTGTTAIQGTLSAARTLLAEHDVTYPGEGIAHHDEAKALRQRPTGWQHDHSRPPDPDLWSRLVREVNSTPGRVVISSEFFADADAGARARLISDLGAERVHILAAAREATSLALSTWQQVLKEGYPVSVETWLQRNFRREDPDAEPTGFWGHADPGVLSRTWAETVVPGRVTFVALDDRDRQLLPSTFERLLDLPAGLLADRVPTMTNRGLTAAEASLLREVNAGVASQLGWREYNRLVRDGMVRRLVEVREPGRDEVKARLPQWAVQQAVAQSEHSIAALLSSGVRVVGDVEVLRPVRVPSGDGTLPAEIPVNVATEAVIGVLVAQTRGGPALREPRGKGSGRRLSEITMCELVRVLGRRVRAGVGRRVRSGRSRLLRRPSS